VLTRLRGNPFAQRFVGRAAARYLKLVYRTNRFALDPPDLYERIGPLRPVIIAMWHGQHFMVPFLRRPQDRVASLVSRSRDGELNAIAVEALGLRPIRGSGARGRDMKAKGGVRALREMLRALEGGETVALTADIPKISRRCGDGIVLLAQRSGRPIVPSAVVTSRRVDLKSWDRASLSLPFGRGVIAVGEPIFVPVNADAQALEEARARVEASLDALHAHAYGLVGSTDPGRRAALAP
jgi:lysophospholipid acyltransferase (LPLAT)-like uncharacterized protein